MNRILLGTSVLLILTGCSRNSDSLNSNETTQNENVMDTTAWEQTVYETSSQDITPQVDVEQVDVDNLYKNGLVLSKGKKSKKRVVDNDDLDITLPVTITNNTGIDLDPEDYVINYKVEEMYETSEGLDSRLISATQEGPEIANGETVTVKLFKSNVLDIRNPKVKLKLDKQKFVERLNEVN